MKRIAVVTGGGRGIGRAAAEALSADGWTVVVCGRNADVLEDTAASLAGDGLAVVADVADWVGGADIWCATWSAFIGKVF